MKIKNILIQFLLILLKPFISKQDTDRFLIVSTTGLGDTLWGTPAIRALRQKNPEAYMGVLTSQTGAQVLQNNPHISEIFVIEKSLLSVVKLYKKLKTRKIGTVFVFHTSQRFILPFCFLLGPTHIIGSSHINKDLDFLLTKTIPPIKIHEIERRLHIIGDFSDSKFMEIFPTVEDMTKVKHFFSTACVIGFHPGAKDKFKQWHPSNFIQLGKSLQREFGCKILVTGNSSEKKLIDMIVNNLGDATGIYQDFSILNLAALLSRLSLFITNDTGPLHIASATKTPTLALFTPTDPELCGPYFAPHVKVVQKKPTCSPCLRKKCQDPFCLLQITPSEVLEMVRSSLKGSA